ncbi:Serine/threonine protein kinase [Giardia duodenalis assemblage B]|uniref:Serine/threonine protein kinase n=1 Tax=Giardia duodenalis assemblage B TaxID=1394984 RepID=A0A132NSX5_GIAIN|nr:Serine/threonine protein kinase [Giardia intestinalis assemblage B]
MRARKSAVRPLCCWCIPVRCSARRQTGFGEQAWDFACPSPRRRLSSNKKNEQTARLEETGGQSCQTHYSF